MRRTAPVRHIACLVLALAFVLVAPSTGARADWTPVEPCFSGEADWTYLDDARAIRIKQCERDGITYFVADVQLADASGFLTALSNDEPYSKREVLSRMAKRKGAILAFNGDDFGVHGYGTIIRNGELLQTTQTTRNMLIVGSEGDLSVRTDRKGENPEELGRTLIEAGTRQTFEFGPELVRNGEAVPFDPAFDALSTNPTRREPRTAIGQIGKLHYAIVVADGRQEGYSKGMTLPELKDLFVELGAHTAMNLDGGGSSEMWFQGEIISRPSQGKERGLADMIYF